MEEYFSISEASSRFNIQRQTIYVAIKKHRLKAIIVEGKWRFTAKDWDDYIKSKYDRHYTLREGKPIYDEAKGLLSPAMIEKNYGIDRQHIYYYLRSGKIPYTKNRCSYIIKNEDLLACPYLKKGCKLKRV